MLLAAADKPADSAAGRRRQVVASDQLNDARSRAADSKPGQPARPCAMAVGRDAAAPRRRSWPAARKSSTWDQTSLIGKIFIAFGALLTMASAARMFMA